MPHFSIEKAAFFGFLSELRRSRMAPCSYGVASAACVCQSPANRWPMKADSSHCKLEGAPRMGLRALFIVAVLIGSSQLAEAAEHSVLRRVSCSVVRFYVAKYSASAAEAWARSKGASEAEIESARRCLKGSPMVTAQY
jgi:hypothetical protein